MHSISEWWNWCQEGKDLTAQNPQLEEERVFCFFFYFDCMCMTVSTVKKYYLSHFTNYKNPSDQEFKGLEDGLGIKKKSSLHAFRLHIIFP